MIRSILFDILNSAILKVCKTARIISWVGVIAIAPKIENEWFRLYDDNNVLLVAQRIHNIMMGCITMAKVWLPLKI